MPAMYDQDVKAKVGTRGLFLCWDVVIQDPHLDGDALTYSIKLLDGTVPTATGPCALFIDPLGRPVSPVSVAGMHRRSRRRAR